MGTQGPRRWDARLQGEITDWREENTAARLRPKVREVGRWARGVARGVRSEEGAGDGGVRPGGVRGHRPAARHLQVSDDAVLDVLLLLAQEVEAHGVERVGAELILPQQHLQWGGEVGGTGWARAAAPGGRPPPGPARTCSMSICTRPTMLTTLLSRRPVCLDWKDESRMVERRPDTRPRKGNDSTWGHSTGEGWRPQPA